MNSLHHSNTLANMKPAELRQRLQAADLPTLLMTVAFLTKDLSILRQQWKPTVALAVATSTLSDAEDAKARDLCCDKLVELRANDFPIPTELSMDVLSEMGHWLIGPAVDPIIPLIAEECVFNGRDLRRPQWHKDHLAPDRNFSVAIIGAGVSGIMMGIRLKQAGVPFVIYEKNPGLGGTWYENHYPGCRVDINNFVYSYSIEQDIWPDYFSSNETLRQYLERVAKKHGVIEHIRFDSPVADMHWNEAASRWDIQVDGTGGPRDEVAQVVVFAVGQLNRPKMPDIPGIDRFAGPSFHSARWDHDIDFAGKRVGVIGTGASATQFIPQVARSAAEVTIFSRTVNWLLPTPDLQHGVSPDTAWLMQQVPSYALWYRASLMMPQTLGVFDDVVVDPSFPPDEKAVSARNAALSQAILDWMAPQIADRPDLREAYLPSHPVGGKRIVRDDGRWATTLKRDNVRVVRTGIQEITPGGIVTNDGVEHQFDVILYGTGFKASEFLVPVNVRGRRNASLHDNWGIDPRTYIGGTVPGFPNMFCIYGPNTNQVVHGGSVIVFFELTVKYIMDAVQVLLANDHQAAAVRKGIFDAYNERVDRANSQLAWGFSDVNSWYKNSSGRVTQNYPFSAAEFWRRTDRFIAADYEIA